MEVTMNCYEHNHEDISITEESENLIVFNLRNGTISQLNSMGQIIWTNIPNKSVEEIVDLIVEKYDAERKEVQDDVQEYIDKLLENRLIFKKQ